MLGLTKKTDYALLALSYLARGESGQVVRTKTIAEQFDIPSELLAKILQKLARSGMLTSTPGPTGGYVLARSADEITIGGVVRAVEGSPALTQCLKSVDNECEQRGKCTIRGPLERVNARVFQMLDRTTLTEITAPETGAPGAGNPPCLVGEGGLVPAAHIRPAVPEAARVEAGAGRRGAT